MLKHTVRFSELRMSESAEGEGDKPAYNCAGNLIWSLDQRQVELSLLNGPMPRAVLRELLAFFCANGIERVIADRAGGHALPLAHRLANGRYEMRVKELADRFMPATADGRWKPR